MEGETEDHPSGLQAHRRMANINDLMVSDRTEVRVLGDKHPQNRIQNCRRRVLWNLELKELFKTDES